MPPSLASGFLVQVAKSCGLSTWPDLVAQSILCLNLEAYISIAKSCGLIWPGLVAQLMTIGQCLVAQQSKIALVAYQLGQILWLKQYYA